MLTGMGKGVDIEWMRGWGKEWMQGGMGRNRCGNQQEGMAPVAAEGAQLKAIEVDAAIRLRGRLRLVVHGTSTGAGGTCGVQEH